MRPRALTATLCLTVGACYSPPEPPPGTPVRALETSEVVFQAVDAGTGAALSDPEMTVRYLVRKPITFDASAVQRVPSIEPYRISHAVGEPTLELEVRVEAPSYHRLDTVLTVPRGGSAGPLTMRLSRRLDLVASDPGRPDPEPVRPPPDRPTDGAAGGGSGEDRSAMQRGDAAYQRSDWLAATEAYQQMPVPSDQAGPYGRDFVEAKTRQGIAHIERSEFARALEVLEEASVLDSPPPTTFLRLAEAQCAVGRSEEGRGTLAELLRARSRMTPVMQNTVTALVEYERGVCTHGEFDRAQTTRERVRTGAAAMRELQGFIQGAEEMAPRPPEIQTAVDDAERRVEEIRRTVGQRGGGGDFLG